MIQARVAWAPHPYRAGFCITDDTDAATAEQVKAVYDVLLRNGLRTTKTVWAFPPQEPCGIPATPPSTLRGVTLEDPDYLAYCRALSAAGFEISLHGASAGNNRRESTRRALDLLAREFGPSDTFICHSKNADNLYWEHKVTRLQPFRWLLRRMSRHQASGEIPSSPYFWGDLCRERINQIRLMRTRRTNTLARNPSMPYHDPRKPFVNGWFSATKRPLAECAAPSALARLKREGGLTVLYQYLHRYARPEGLDPAFLEAVENLAADREILVDTASNQMRRLRQMQGLFLVEGGREAWFVNVNGEPVLDVRVRCSQPVSAEGDLACSSDADGLVLPEIPPGVHRLAFSTTVRFSGPRVRRGSAGKIVRFRSPGVDLRVNPHAGRTLADASGPLAPRSFALSCGTSGTGLPLLSRLSFREEFRLLTDQALIIAREILFKGRSLDPQKYLDASSSSIPLEDHARW